MHTMYNSLVNWISDLFQMKGHPKLLREEDPGWKENELNQRIEVTFLEEPGSKCNNSKIVEEYEKLLLKKSTTY